MICLLYDKIVHCFEKPCMTQNRRYVGLFFISCFWPLGPGPWTSEARMIRTIKKYKRVGMIYTNASICICTFLILLIHNPEANQKISPGPQGPGPNQGDVFNLICFRI